MTRPASLRCELMIDRGLPVVVWQAADDLTVSDAAVRLLLKLSKRLDFVEFREISAQEVVKWTGCKLRNASRTLNELVDGGYLEATVWRQGQNKPRKYRLPWSQHVQNKAA
jgi:hypothetical protein